MAFIVLSVMLVVILLAAVWATRREPRTPWANYVRRVALVAAGASVCCMLMSTVTVVHAGHVGVVDVFGNVSDRTLAAGIQLVNPMARVVQMSIQTHEFTETMDVPSREGVTMSIEVIVRYHLDPEKAADVYRSVGQNLVGGILEPQFRSVTRGVTAAYDADTLAASPGDSVAQMIARDLKQRVEPRGIVIESTPMRRLTQPGRIEAAIDVARNAGVRASPAA